MKKKFNHFLQIIAFLSIGLVFNSCKTDEDDPPPTVSLFGTYTVASATFNPAVDLDGPGPLPATTNATALIESGLFGASPCNPKTVANVQIEFASNGDFNLICANAPTTKVKIGTFSVPDATSINLTNITVPNPAPPPATATIPLLSLTNVSAVQQPGGQIQLNARIPAFPYSINPQLSANVELVLNKLN